MNRSALFIVCFLLVAGSRVLTCRAAGDTRYARPLDPAAGNDGMALGTAELPAATYARLARDFADLRIVRADGEEVPRLVRKRVEQRRERITRHFAAELLSFEQLPDGAAEILVKARKETVTRPHVLTIETPLRNFEKDVTVLGSDDRQTWRELAAAEPIVDYSRFVDLRRTAVSFGPAVMTYFKVLVSRVSRSRQSPLTRIVRETRGGEPVSEIEKTSFRRSDFRIDRVTLGEYRHVVSKREPVMRTYPGSIVSIERDGNAKTTRVTVDAGGVPVTEFRLAIADENFSRPVVVQARRRDRDDAWRRVGGGTLRSIRLGTYSEEELTITTADENRAPTYRLVIDDGDSPPLRIEDVTLRGPVYDVVFLRDASSAYRLVYGGGETEAPDYDIAPVVAQASAADMASYGVGAETTAAAADAGRPRIDTRLVLVVCALVMVAVLAWVVVGAARKVGA